MTSSSAYGEGLFLAPEEADAGEQRRPTADHSAAGMDRLRHPFAADPLDALERQQLAVFNDED